MSGNKAIKPAIQIQKEHVRYVMSRRDSTFGIERFVRMVLVMTPFLFPTLYVRHLAGKWGVVARKQAVEWVVIAKLVMLIMLVVLTSAKTWPAVVALYFLSETVLYLLAIVLLSDIYSPPISKGRSFLLLIMNYAEVNMSFGLIHFALGGINGIKNKIDAVYFSFVTFATLGYGDMHPTAADAKLVVILEVIVMLLFVFLFFANFVPRIGRAN